MTNASATKSATTPAVALYEGPTEWVSDNPIDYPAALTAALAAVDTIREGDESASGVLKATALAAYRGYARQIMQAGASVLASSGPVSKATVQAMVWGAATGTQKAPAKDDRTPALTSLGQYLSRFSAVATDAAYGTPALLSVDTFNSAEKAVRERKAAEKAALDLLTADAAARDLTKWIARLPQSDQAAIARTLDLFRLTSVGISHTPAFADRLALGVTSSAQEEVAF